MKGEMKEITETLGEAQVYSTDVTDKIIHAIKLLAAKAEALEKRDQPGPQCLVCGRPLIVPVPVGEIVCSECCKSSTAAPNRQEQWPNVGLVAAADRAFREFWDFKKTRTSPTEDIYSTSEAAFMAGFKAGQRNAP